MGGLTIADFDAYFQALHDYAPYPWQRRLADRAVHGDWPGAIDLPTASGKTACIDIAVFALACQASLPVDQRTSPRRIFFCVNRRVIVDEAYTRARHIAEKILKAETDTNGSSVLFKIAAALRVTSGTTADDDTPPLDVLELRGGIYRDNRWARSITQPTIVCTTLDQLGSRLLFRGYGVSTNAAPIQAALIAYDSLILLDEAHISEPFRQTLDFVTCYLDPDKWAEQSIGLRPVTVVPMTATPNDEMRQRGVLELEDDDRDPKLPLLARLTASRPAELPAPTKDVAEEAITLAQSLNGDKPLAVGIIVNRIATAMAIYDQLRSLQSEPSDKKRKIPDNAAIELVIGSMRPIDRDQQADRLRSLVGPNRPPTTKQTSFIVATQCLEVGADYDFDALITECASLDALRQRFGRLNRAGREINANAFILANKKDIKDEDKLDNDKPLDPIYGNALARTWNWLNEHATEVTGCEKPVKRINFGIDAFNALLDQHAEDGRPPQNLLAPSASLNAPVMMPAYVDLWCQTAPQPVPDPDVSLFIHGPQGGEPDVQVCWRADIGESNHHPKREDWCDVVALLPPTSAECISMPISRVRHWLADQTENQTQDHGDLLGISATDSDDKKNRNIRTPSLQHPGVLWRGSKDSKPITSPYDLRPGDTLVLPALAQSSRSLGHLPDVIPNDPPADHESNAARQMIAVNDVAETAFTLARDRVALRLHPTLRTNMPAGEVLDDLFAAATSHDELPTRPEWATTLRAAADAIPDVASGWKKVLHHLAENSFHIEPYPDRLGVVLTGRQGLGTSINWFVPSMDDGEDETSRIERDAPILLANHTRHVHESVRQSLAGLPLGTFVRVYELAANLHDLGKADERFQAMMRRTDRTDAWLLAGVTSALLAKSGGMPASSAERDAARTRAGLPADFRHEMLSVQLAERSAQLPDDDAQRDLILHLIAAHHGHGRPFAPVVIDDELPAIEVKGVALTHEQRKAIVPSHRLDSGIAYRFWLLTRRFGWWGLAYLEAVLRLADQQASAAEEAGEYDDKQAEQAIEVTA